MGKSFTNLLGQSFGRLTVEAVAGKNNSGNYKWVCRCACGVKKEIPGDHLVRKKQPVVSCGCFRNDQVRATYPHPDNAAFKSVIFSYRKNARMKNRDFTLSEDEFRKLTSANCHYCGSQPSTWSHNKSKTGTYVHNGVDRIDPTKGYVTANCVPCCSNCNYMKLDHSLSDFLGHVLKIVKHMKATENG